METKEKIVETLTKNGITSVWKAIQYLEGIGLSVIENEYKWEVEASDGEFIRFKNDDELMSWAIEHRDKIDD